MVAADVEGGARGILHPPDRGGRDGDRVAHQVVDRDDLGLLRLDRERDLGHRRQRVAPPEAVAGDGAVIAPEQGQHRGLPRLEGDEPGQQHDPGDQRHHRDQQEGGADAAAAEHQHAAAEEGQGRQYEAGNSKAERQPAVQGAIGHILRDARSSHARFPRIAVRPQPYGGGACNPRAVASSRSVLISNDAGLRWRTISAAPKG